MSEGTDTRARILIVEDELIIAQNLKHRLEKLGYSVTNITIDAEETRTALEKDVPDIVLMDIALYGGNDGIILAKWIDRNYKIPVIYVTSHTDNSTFERASKSMPYGYLVIMRDITHRRKTQNILLKIVSAVSAEMGDAFLKTLTKRLTETLEMDYCFLGEIHDKQPEVCTIAESYSAGKITPYDITSFPIDQTPTREIINEKKTHCYQENVQKHFPKDEILNRLNVKGYVGTPLISSAGNIAGVITIMSRSKLEETEIQKSVLQIFANRATAEIERRRYEKRLIAERNRANEMNALKNNFLSNLSHEVRTPLNSIIGFSSLLGEELDNKEQREFLSYIEEGGQRLLQTINDLLDISILESEPDKIQPKKINLESEVIETVGMMINDAHDKDIILDYSIMRPGILVLGDPRMTGQILRKLIGNAIKFTEKGSVFIEVDVAENEAFDCGVVRVKDTGVGIDKKFLPHVFDEFKQESRGMARKFEGVGLGLTIAYKMSELMNGVIEVESEKGKGSVFSFYLPLAGE